MGEPFPDGLISLLHNKGRVLERFFFQSTHFVVFLLLFTISWIQMIRKEKGNYLILFGCFTGLFDLYLIRSGTCFVQHNYYMIPYIPVMAVMIAWMLVSVPNRQWAMALLVMGMVEGIVW